MAVAVSPLRPKLATTPEELNEQKVPSEMTWRPPGRSAEPQSDEDDSDKSPHSISLSVSDVGTSVFREMQLCNLARGDTLPPTGNLPVGPSNPPKGEIKVPAKRGNGLKREEARAECDTEAVCTVVTRDRGDTPSGSGVDLFASTEGARPTFVRHGSS